MPDQFAVSSVGDNVTLACTPGDTSVSIDWYRGDQLLTASSKYIFSPTIQRHMLTITDVQLNDANCYYCTLADSETRDDLKIELIVIEGIYMNVLYIANRLMWKSFVAFVDQLVTAKLSTEIAYAIGFGHTGLPSNCECFQ